jgi:hypothetical protein
MPVRIQRIVPVTVPLSVAAAGLAIVGFLYATSPAPPEATLAGRLTAGGSGRAGAALVGVIGLIWGASSLVGGHFQRRQLVELGAVATAMGMQRVSDPSELTDPGLDLPVLRRQMSALMRGRHEGTDVLVGCFTVGGEHAYNTAVACYRLPRELPAFALSPEGLADKLSSVLGAADIDIETHPTFSAAYRLRSSDEAATRSLFSDTPLRDRRAADKGWYAECNGYWVGLYRHDEAIARAALPQFLQRTTPLFRALLGR